MYLKLCAEYLKSSVFMLCQSNNHFSQRNQQGVYMNIVLLQHKRTPTRRTLHTMSMMCLCACAVSDSSTSLQGCQQINRNTEGAHMHIKNY